LTSSIVMERHGRLASISIRRPPLNILNLTAIQDLRHHLGELMVDKDLQLLVLRGSGQRAFSAGVAVEDHSPEKVPDMLGEFHRAISILRDLPAITVAVVQGHCLGGGMELAAGCDLIVASQDSRFGQPEIKLGCFPPLAAALYPSLLGPKRTFDLLLTGRTVTCEEAVEMGLVNRCVPDPELDSTVDELVQTILGHSLIVTRLTKRAIRAGQNQPFAEALALSEHIYLDELTETADMPEGLAAFMEKRRPEWNHR